MDKPQSLADLLGVPDPQRPENPTSTPQPARDAQTFCQNVLNTAQYRESLLRRILMDELPPAVEVWLLNTAHGKPTDRVEIKDTTNRLAEFSTAQLEQRALDLAKMARSLAPGETPGEPIDKESIH